MHKCKDTNEYYHEQKQYLSSTFIKTITKKSLLHALEQKPVQSNHFTVGSAFHSYVLERDMFQHEFFVAPKVNKRTKAGKEQWEDFTKKAESEHKQIINEQDFDMIKKMCQNIFHDETCNKLLSNGEPEVSFYDKDFMKTWVKVRPDYYVEDKYVVDLKSCQDASPRAFKYDILRYGWHIQAAFYMDVCEVNEFYFIASEKNHPHACQAYKLSDDLINQGRQAYQEAIKIWKDYVEFGNISKYQTDNMTDNGVIIL
tara:strand:+ start:389 stop:1156 length:768 start_codon:yes stop_codon:yes gene_type:complete